MNVVQQKHYRRLGACTSIALAVVVWLSARPVWAIPVPAEINLAAPSSSVTAKELKSLLTFPQGIPLGGLSNFWPSIHVGEQLLSVTDLPLPTISSGTGAKGFPDLDASVNLQTPTLIQQMVSTLN